MATRSSESGADAARPGRGFAGAIAVSALGHAALAAFIFLVVPQFLSARTPPPPSYTVKIVDSLPAGDLGTHLPKLASRSEAAKAQPPAAQPPTAVSEPRPEAPPPAVENDKNAIALNDITPTPTPPAPPPTPEPTPAGSTPEPTRAPAVRTTPVRTPKAVATPQAKLRPRSIASPVGIAKADHPLSVKEQLAKVREQLLAQQLVRDKKADRAARSETAETEATPASAGPAGGGPVVASVAREGKGYGIGSGTGSEGIQNDLDFLLYYQSVQERIKKAWSFPGGDTELTTTVDFAIGPDGGLTQVKIAQSSRDSSFDDSVVRAIKRAAPFPPPPEKYREQFGEGIEALFKLGELSS